MYWKQRMISDSLVFEVIDGGCVLHIELQFTNIFFILGHEIGGQILVITNQRKILI